MPASSASSPGNRQSGYLRLCRLVRSGSLRDLEELALPGASSPLNPEGHQQAPKEHEEPPLVGDRWGSPGQENLLPRAQTQKESRKPELEAKDRPTDIKLLYRIAEESGDRVPDPLDKESWSRWRAGCTLRRQLGIRLLHYGMCEEAAVVFQKNALLDQSVLGPHHSTTLKSRVHLLLAHCMLSQYEEAANLCVELTRISKLRARCLSGTCFTCKGGSVKVLRYLNENKIHEGELRQEWTENRQTLGKDHPETLRSQFMLASMSFQSQKLEARRIFAFRWEEILSHFEFDREKDLELDYMSKFKSRERQDILYANRLLLKNWEDRHRVLGRQHPQTLQSLQFLADTFFKLQMYEDAASTSVRGFLTGESTMGGTSKEALRSLQVLSKVLFAVGEYVEAYNLGQILLSRLTSLPALERFRRERCIEGQAQEEPFQSFDSVVEEGPTSMFDGKHMSETGIWKADNILEWRWRTEVEFLQGQYLYEDEQDIAAELSFQSIIQRGNFARPEERQIVEICLKTAQRQSDFLQVFATKLSPAWTASDWYPKGTRLLKAIEEYCVGLNDSPDSSADSNRLSHYESKEFTISETLSNDSSRSDPLKDNLRHNSASESENEEFMRSEVFENGSNHLSNDETITSVRGSSPDQAEATTLPPIFRSFNTLDISRKALEMTINPSGRPPFMASGRDSMMFLESLAPQSRSSFLSIETDVMTIEAEDTIPTALELDLYYAKPNQTCFITRDGHLDTKAGADFISSELAELLGHEAQACDAGFILTGAGPIRAVGQISVFFDWRKCSKIRKRRFLVIENLPVDIVLGINFISQSEVFTLGKALLVLALSPLNKEEKKQLKAKAIENRERRATEEKEEEERNRLKRESRIMMAQSSQGPSQESQGTSQQAQGPSKQSPSSSRQS